MMAMEVLNWAGGDEASKYNKQVQQEQGHATCNTPGCGLWTMAGVSPQNSTPVNLLAIAK